MTCFGLGKIILLGEHAVVYGYPALAAALDRGVTIAPVPTPAGGPLRVDLPAWNLKITSTDDHPLAAALCAIADAIGVGRPAVSLVGDAQIPAGAGLGASAAFAVAIARALYQIKGGGPPALAAVIAAANAGEQHVHGNASGVDVALAASGGVGVFRKTSGLRAMSCKPLRVLVGPSGSPRSTSAMVERVSQSVSSNADDKRLRELAGLTDAGAAALVDGKLIELGQAMDRAHAVLGALGVSTPVLDGLCEAARATGAYGAKLTGAGGGGAVIAIAPREREADVLSVWKSAGVNGLVATVGGR